MRWRKRTGFLRDERGNIAMFVILSLPFFFAMATLAVDMGYLWSVQAQLRAAADAAVLAAVRSIDDKERARSLAIEYATKNMQPSKHGDVLKPSDVVFGQWVSESGTFAAGRSPLNAVQVTVRRADANGNAVDLFFAHYVGMGEPNVVVEAVASVKTGQGTFCVLALEQGASGGLGVGGNAKVILKGCGIAVNSASPTALTMKGQSEVLVEKAGISVVGDIRRVGGARLKSGYAPETGSRPIPDPFASLYVPNTSRCDFDDKLLNKNAILSPGVYCGGLSITGQTDVQLNPGVYIVKDGDLRIQGGATVRGDGVIFILTGSSPQGIGSLTLAGHSEIRLTAPTSGPFKGIQLFQDRNASPNGRNKIVGTSKGGSPTKLQVNGALYFPSRELFIAGDTRVEAADGGCVLVVARQIALAGKGELAIECDEALAGPVGLQRFGVRLRK